MSIPESGYSISCKHINKWHQRQNIAIDGKGLKSKNGDKKDEKENADRSKVFFLFIIGYKAKRNESKNPIDPIKIKDEKMHPVFECVLIEQPKRSNITNHRKKTTFFCCGTEIPVIPEVISGKVNEFDIPCQKDNWDKSCNRDILFNNDIRYLDT